jgi:hypothetical protein
MSWYEWRKYYKPGRILVRNNPGISLLERQRRSFDGNMNVHDKEVS